ncbi:MAG TPA: DUF4157 domain-containing protein [Kofleriaceae bacterium]|jgi:hypothetical protein
MTNQREQAHATATTDAAARDDDLAPGRVNRAALLSAPAHPLESGILQRKADRDGNGVAAGSEQAVASAAGSSSHGLPETLMRKFESSLGADLSGVRVHTGTESATAAESVGAKAYTVGQDIHFGAGHYDPSSPTGQHLLAHEVAHTVQQHGGTPARQNKLEVSTPFDAAEHEADRAADAMIGGQHASVGGASSVARQALFRDADPKANAQVADAKAGFDLATHEASLKFVLIANQQAVIVQQTKEAADSKDKMLAMEIIADIVGGAIGALAGPLGAAIAAKVASVAVQKLTQDLAKKAIQAAFAKGAAFAKSTAESKIKQAPDTSTAAAYFNCLQLTYAALAGHHADEYLNQMQAVWASVKTDPAAAADAKLLAEASRDGMQAGLDDTSYATDTQNAAFSGWCTALSHSGHGGVLELETTVADKGNSGNKLIESATIAGISGDLAGAVTGRQLSVYALPIMIKASYFSQKPSVGASDDEGGGDQLHQFVVNVDENGRATAGSSDPWLLARGAGDANAGAQSFYSEMSSLPIPLKSA